MATTFAAKYRGTCADQNCTRPVEPGDDVVFVDQELFHDECALGASTNSALRPITRPVCQTCFTEQSVSGDCAC